MASQPGSNSEALVAIVTNDPTQQSLLSLLARKAGTKPLTFPGAEEALSEMGNKGLPSLIITSLYMAGIDGWRFCRLLRSPEFSSFNNIPIIVVSQTFSGEEPDRIAADLGAEAFFHFPVAKEEFITQIQAVLGGSKKEYYQHVLLAEDNQSTTMLLKEAFEANSYSVTTVKSLADAEKAMGKYTFDVAAIDYHLPDGKGDILIEKYKKIQSNCVFIMITIDPGPELALMWMKKGAAAYLRKPFEPAYLVELCFRARRERSLLRAQDLLKERTILLKESEQKIRAILNAMPDTMILFDSDCVVTECHIPAGSPLFAVKKTIKGSLIDKIFPESSFPELAKSRMPIVANSNIATSFSFEAQGKSGRIYIEAKMAACSAGTYLVILQDVTEPRKAAEESEKLQAQLIHAQKMESVGRLAGGVAHDFNNMLSVILGRSDMALDTMKNTDPYYADFTEIKTAAEKSAKLTKQLLAFARRQAVTPKVINLNTVVSDMLNMLKRLMGENIELELVPGENLKNVKTDISQIDQILANLCINARDAVGNRGIIRIETSNMEIDSYYCSLHPEFIPGEYVMLSVTDNGCGIDTEALPNLFEPFYTTKGVGKGTGLGLSTVYGIVKQNMGYINVYSEKGIGSVFKVYLPAYSGNIEPDRQPEKTELPRKKGYKTILLVEDELSILNMISTMLGHLGYTVLTAATPRDALKTAESYNGIIDLLITDVIMPEMNGKELANKMIEIYPGLKRLYMSGYSANIIEAHGVLEEGIHFIQKPFSIKQLSGMVWDLLEK